MTMLGWRTRWLGVALALATGPVATPPVLQAQARARTPQVTASIIPESRSIRPGTPLRVAIRLLVAPGWHIYWTNPGESGIPTTVRWTGPAGFTAGPLQWPYPERKELAGLVVHAYEGEIVLVGTVYPPSGLAMGSHPEVAAHVHWGVCREVCIPQEARLSFSLPVDERRPRPSAHWSRIAREAGLRIPHSVAGWTLQANRKDEGVVLRVIPPAEGTLPGGSLTFFPEDTTILPAAVSVVPEREGRGVILHLSGPSSHLKTRTPVRLRGILIAASGWDAAGRFRALRVDVPVER